MDVVDDAVGMVCDVAVGDCVDDGVDDARESVVTAEQVLCVLSAVRFGARNVH